MESSGTVLMMTPGNLRQYRILRSPLEIPPTWFRGGYGPVDAPTLRRIRDTITRYVASGLLSSTPPWVPWRDQDIDRLADGLMEDSSRAKPTPERYYRDGGIFQPVTTSGVAWLTDIQLALTADDLRSQAKSAILEALSWSSHERPMSAEDVYAAAAYLTAWEADQDIRQHRMSTPAARLAMHVRDRLRTEETSRENPTVNDHSCDHVSGDRAAC